MQNRRTFFGLAAAALPPVCLDGQAPTSPPRGELARHALTGPLEGYDAVLIEASRQANPDVPARFLAFFVVPKGSPLAGA